MLIELTELPLTLIELAEIGLRVRMQRIGVHAQEEDGEAKGQREEGETWSAPGCNTGRRAANAHSPALSDRESRRRRR